MGKVHWFRSFFGWHIVLENMGYKGRVEYRLRIWRGIKHKRRKK